MADPGTGVVGFTTGGDADKADEGGEHERRDPDHHRDSPERHAIEGAP